MNFKTRYLLLALLIAGVTFCYVQFNPVAEPVHLRVLGGIGLLQLAVSLRGWKRLTGSVFVPYTVFLGAAYVFTFGQSLLDVFGAVTPGRDLRETLSIGSIYAAQYVTLQFLAFFHMGGAGQCPPGRPSGGAVASHTGAGTRPGQSDPRVAGRRMAVRRRLLRPLCGRMRADVRRRFGARLRRALRG